MPGVTRDRDAAGNNDRMRVSAPSRISVGVVIRLNVSEMFDVINNRQGRLLTL